MLADRLLLSKGLASVSNKRPHVEKRTLQRDQVSEQLAIWLELEASRSWILGYTPSMPTGDRKRSFQFNEVFCGDRRLGACACARFQKEEEHNHSHEGKIGANPLGAPQLGSTVSIPAE